MKTNTLNPRTPRKPFPWEHNGSTYFTNDAGERVWTGSQMGRRNVIPEDASTVRKLHLRRVRPLGTQSGADYDKGGAYWGDIARKPLYCAFGESDTECAELYTRAKSREEAKGIALRSFPNARFYR